MTDAANAPMPLQAPGGRPHRENASYGGLPQTRSQKQASSEAGRIKPKDVYKALEGDDETRSGVLARFRALGGDLNRWNRGDRAVMAEAIIRTEDALEGDARGRMTAQRLTLRDVRLRLELEVWP
jgi:hypothetical protein